MKNQKEIWVSMIISVYAKKQEIPISKAAEQLLSDGGMSYLEDCYEALHT